VTAWNTVDPNDLLPQPLVSAVSALTDVITGALESAAGALSLPSFPSLPSPPSTAAVVVETILKTLESLLKGGRIHTLVVPIAKTIPRQSAPALPPTLGDLEASLALTLGPSDTIAADAYASMIAKTGGNAGFYNAFAESLMDPADPNRPQYDNQSDAVAMTVLLIGAPRYSSITSAASMLDQLTLPKSGNGTASRTVPIPQNVRTRVVGSSTAPSIGVRIDWDVPPTVFSSPYFPGIATTVRRYAVIRSTSPKAQSARSVLDFFSTQALTEGMSNDKSKVIAIGAGRNSAFLDTDAPLDPKVPVYYCVAWENTVNEAGSSAVLPFDRVSNVAKIEVKAPTPPQTGKSPDWVATESAIAAFPPLARAAQTLIEETRVILASAGGTSKSRLSDAMKLAASASDRLSARATELLNDVTQLSTALSRPIPSLYVTQMSSGTGGNAFLLKELAKRLGDRSDDTRPPFDNGEYVCGVCFVAGAPRLADLAATIAFFDALFGPATSANPLMGLLAAIDTAVTQAEEAVFGPDMQPLPPGTVVNPLTGKPPTAPTVTIADSGTPVDTESPANPNAGDTNVTPMSERC
jgi:hypothetical protein